MVYKETIIKIGDNSGAISARCIHAYTTYPAKVGSFIKVSITKVLASESDRSIKVKKGELFKAVLVNTTKSYKRKNGLIVGLGDNVAILVNIQGKILGSRVFYAIPYEVRKSSMLKLFSLAPIII